MLARIVSFLCIALLIVPSGNAQGSHKDWTTVQQLRPGDRLAVQLKNGQSLRGGFAGSSDSAVTILVDNAKKEVDRNDVRKVHRLSGSIYKSTLIGTGIGAAAGAVIGASVNSRDCCLNKGAVVGILMTAGVLIGTGLGFLVGLGGHHGDLIYEAP